MTIEQIEDITREAIKVFNLNEDAVFNMKVDNGLRYLDERFANDHLVRDPLKSHAEFWLWWRDLWAQRDLKLIGMCEPKLYGFRYTFPIGKPIKTAKGEVFTPTDSISVLNHEVWDLYKSFHHPRNVNFYPNHILIQSCLEKSIF